MKRLYWSALKILKCLTTEIMNRLALGLRKKNSLGLRKKFPENHNCQKLEWLRFTKQQLLVNRSLKL